MPRRALPVSVILGISMVAAGVVYPVTDSALHHTSPIMIATLRALLGGVLLCAMLPLMRSRLPRTRRLWRWAFGIGFGGVLLVVLSDPGNVAHGSQLVIGFALALLGALGWAGGGLGMRVLTQREPDLDIPGITAAQFLAGGVPLIPLVLVAGGSTDWGRPVLDAQLLYLVIGGQVLVYLGFNAALSRWPSTRVYAWTFLVPAVAVVVDAFLGKLPGVGATAGVVTVIAGVAIVNHPRAEARRPTTDPPSVPAKAV